MSSNLEFALKLSIAQTGLENVNALIRELKTAGLETDKFEKEAAQLGAELKKLGSEQGMVEAFKKLKTETQFAEKAMGEAKTKVAELARELKAIEQPTRAQQAAFEKARKTARDAATAYNDKRASLQQLRGQMQQAGLSASDLASHQVRLRKTQEDLANRGQALTQSLKSSAEAAKVNAAAAERASKAWSLFKSGLGAGVGFAAAQVGLNGLTGTFNKLREGIMAVAQTGGQFEALRVQLQTLYGSAAQAESAFSWIKSFTTTTPFELEQVTQGFIKLKAMGMDPMDGSFQAIADQASALGASGETLNGIVLALGQAWSKQKLQGEEALQLIERGVPVWELLAQATGKNAAELQDMSSKGLLGRDAIRALIDEMGRMNGGAAERAMQTLNGQIANLKDNWANFLNLIAESGALEYFKDELKAINEAVAEMARTGELKQWAKEAADAIKAIGEAIKSGVLFVHDYGGALASLGKVAIGLKAVSLGKTLLGWGKDALASAAMTETAASRMNKAGALALAGWAGWEFGTYLKNEFVEVEQAGIALAAGLTKMAERARFAFEVLNTPIDSSTIDNISAAYDRMQQRLVAIDDEYSAMFVAAGRATEKQKEVGAAGEQAGKQAAAGTALATTAAERLLAALNQTGAAGAKAGEDIRSALGGVDVTTLDGVLALSDAFLLAGENAGKLEQAVIDVVGQMDEAELAAFANSLSEGFKSGQLEAEAFARINEQVLSESFKRMGLSAEEALGRISPAAQKAINAVDAIRASLENSSIIGEAKMQALGIAIQQALSGADTLAAAEAIRERIEAMGKTGELAGRQLEQAMLAVKGRIDELTPGINSVEEALKKLGITSQAALKQVADEAREAYLVIREGAAAAEEKRLAWLRMAEAVIKSGDPMLKSTLEIEAGALGLREELDRLVTQQKAVGDATTDTVSTMREQAEAAQQTKRAMTDVADAVNAAADANKRYSEAAREAMDAWRESTTTITTSTSWDNAPDAVKRAAASGAYGKEVQQGYSDWLAQRSGGGRGIPTRPAERLVRIQLEAPSGKQATVYSENETDLIELLSSAKAVS